MQAVERRESKGVNMREGSRELGICENSTRKLIREGKLHVVRVGRRIIIPRASIDKFLAGGK
jgi:excisionase family DNA binding protein